MRKFFIFLIVAITTTSIAMAQEIDKLSAGTQMFLLMRSEEVKNGPQKAITENKFKLRPEVEKGYKAGFAPTEVVNNQEMIDAFIYLKDVNNTSTLESLGVVVMCKFEKFVTAKIPVDCIEKVANIDNVVQIDVSRLLQPKTDVASTVTNADKAWNGINNGLCEEYTGKGVLVGVIDQGIDFKHVAFTDENGNSRVKRVYAPGRSSSVYTSNFPDYDVSGASHGTHTSTTAGGRAITINGTTYSGMAPESDLFLCGLSSLSSINIANSLDKINQYATQQGQPCVVNISLGSQYGAHDGTGSLATAYSDFTSNGTAKGRILCVAAGNEAGGNMYFGGTATSSTPACTSLEYCIYSDVEGTDTYYYSSSYYSEYYVWPQTAGATLKFQFVIIDKTTKSIVYTADAVTPGTSTSSVSLGSSYFKNGNSAASARVSRSTDNYSGKYYYDITIVGTSTENMSQNSDGKYYSRYAVGMLVYSATNSTVKFDCWGDGFSEFLDAKYAGTYGNYSFAKGSDECSIGNEVPTSGVISVGAYVSKKTVTTSNNVSYTSSEYTVGDIAPFSSYSTGCGPDGIVYPDITAPGAILIAGVNRYDTSNYPSSQTSSTEYMTIGNYSDGSRYGSMSGTSMATPTTTGIMALWLQANPELTANDIKQVFSQTAVRDSYVTGTNGAHFGKYGKLDALAGLKKIAPCEDVPTITATPTSIDFGNVTAGATTTKTFNVQGANLEGNISLAVSGTGYSISSTSVTKNTAENGTGATITVTFSPTANVSQTYNGTITLTSSNASTVTVNLTGKGVYTAPVIAASPTSLSFSGNSGSTYTKTVTVTSSNLQGNVTAAIQDDANGFYSVSPTSFNAASQTVTVTWTPIAGGTSTANLVLTTTGTGANTVTVPITGTAQGPTITANPTSVTFTGAYATRTYTQTVTVTGTNLSRNITASLTGANVYSIDKTSLGTSGGTITVTYAPTATGQTQATLTLSSTGASSVTVPITGTAQAATPTLIVEPASLSFTSDLESSDSKTFSVKGRFISENVTLTLTDPNGVFTLGTATIPASSISEETAVNVNVTFQSANEGNFTGSVTVASNGAESQTVNLTATASDGGTASDAYLDITKYATIDEAGWNTSYVNNLYKYTEYDEVAWLTLPVYGAWSSCYYSNHPQTWIQTNVTNTTDKYSGTTWDKNAELLGNTAYFNKSSGNGSARAMGYNSRYNTTQETFTFYVTKATAVKLLGLGQSRTSSDYPATLKVFECTKNADGTVTASNTALQSYSNSATSGAFVLTATNLDETKFYKVEAATYRSYLCEIGFQTPLNKPKLSATPTELSMLTAPGETATATFNVIGKMLSENVTVTLTDKNGVFAVDPATISISDAQNGKNVTVTFSSADEGDFTGIVTLTSGSLSATVTLTGRCSDGGTAKDAYLDIAKYETIDEAGATVSGMSTIYKYTEYEAQDIAWLTVSNYGAMSADDNQNWYTTTSLTQYNNTWSASDIFLGNASYFTNSTSGYSIYGSGNQTFYVTNCSQVKALVKGSGSSWSSASATLAIYECTVNADGTVTAATTATDSQQGGASGTAVITSAALDVSKVYMVRLTGGGSYPDMLEIAFQTPLPQKVTLAQIVNDPSVVAGKQYRIVDDNLIGAYLSNDSKYIFCKDDNGYAEQMTKGNKVDFMTEHGWHNGNWDQSNWIVLNVPAETDLTQSQDPTGHKLSGVRGTLINKVNPTLQLTKVPTPGEQATVNFNTYLATDFDPEMLAETGNYFFLPAKPMEVAKVMWAMWDAASGKFVVASPVNNSTGRIDGAFYADLTKYYNDPSHPIGEIKDGYVYNFTGFAAVNVNGVSASTLKGISTLADETPGMVVYPLANWELKGDSNIITAINGVYSDGYREVVGVEYVNAAGLTSDKPFKGVNIVVTRYSDGSRTTVKKLYR